jgi:hypothetical protein
MNRPLGKGMSAFTKVENLFNEPFEVARSRSGLADMGAPRWVTVGLQAIW